MDGGATPATRSRVSPARPLAGGDPALWGRPGTKAHAEALREEIARVVTGMGLLLSPAKTLITHIDAGLDFLGRRHGQGADTLSTEHEPAARCPAASAQPDAAGLDHVLQVRLLTRDLQL